VPAIIEFSNHLSYDGRLKALREATSAKVGPALVEHRVSGAGVDRKVNRIEALEVASLMAAAMEQPEYAHATFGVISLVGDEQALEVETLLRRHLPPQELEKRRLLCGNPAQFQGDERDVVFLSLVDAPGEGPLAMRQDHRFKKRYNVAASRARDQLWVVHSLDPQLDLKPGDLRRRLIEHARDPWAIASAGAKAEREAESPFEQAVIRKLVAAGYAVRSQWPVGHYRIDLVVEGNGKRLAIECDGERYHPPEALAADLERQAILERLGWKFVRIRGSAFYRDAEAAMKAVFERLEQLGIPPQVQDGPSEVTADALTSRIIQQASALRAAWQAES
jgi:very-short-patch-repair endonuclease